MVGVDRHPNPVIAVIDDGHVERTVSDANPKMTAAQKATADARLHHCKKCAREWPCPTMVEAMVLARIRSEAMIADLGAVRKAERERQLAGYNRT